MQIDDSRELLSGVGDEQSRPHWYTQLRQLLMPASEGQHLEARLYGRVLHIHFSPAAIAAAATLQTPLTIELELYFSCFVRKAVRFHAAPPSTDSLPDSHTRILDHVHVHFHPVTTQHCSMANSPDAPPMETMPVTRPQAFLPRWVEIDFHRGAWIGEYGY
ncbi:MAG: hypothetical protein HZB57_11015 [Gammaproteobacteria bacterium]|nr:hypothetical protein [Gammaproteobacteria bacterium]